MRAQVILLGIYSFIRWRLEGPAAQVETLAEAAPLVADTEDFELYAMIQQRLGWAHLAAGDLDSCLEVTEAALARCGPDRAKAGRLAGYGSQLFMLAQRAFRTRSAGAISTSPRRSCSKPRDWESRTAIP